VNAAGGHHPGCGFSNLDANVTCVPGYGCCAEDHDHAAAANACPGFLTQDQLRAGAVAGHPGEACTIVHPHDPATCKVCLDPAAGEHGPEVGNGGHECAGGHCGPKVSGCTVCRPITITPLPGSAQVAMTARAGG
jgi:hypothetical protein